MDKNTFPIFCIICEQTLKGDQAYLTHMQTEHGTTSPDQAFAKQKTIEQNVPKTVPIGKDVPPSAEFLEIAKQIDNIVKTEPPVVRPETPKVQSPVTATQQEAELTLTYKWEGSCINGHAVKTLLVNNVAVAYCLQCDKAIKQLEVPPLYTEPKRIRIEETVKEFTKPISIRKRGVHHRKRSKSQLLSNTTLPSVVSASRLPETNEPGVQN